MNVVFGRHTVAEALKAGTRITKILIAHGVRNASVLDEIRRLAASAGIPVAGENRRRMDDIAGSDSHQGVVAYVPDFEYVSRDRAAEQNRLVLLDGISDPVNLGSILRSAEALGWGGVMIPSRRSADVTAAVRKTAAGAAERVPVARVGSVAEAVSWLKERGFWIVGLDPAGDQNYDEFSFPDQTCLVVGSEGRGLSRLVRERCDVLLRIPMQGALASFNAAVAAAVVMAEESRRRRLL